MPAPNIQVNDLVNAQQRLSRHLGEWWAEDNARFNATNPSFGRRVIRVVDPRTSLGSSFGDMHTSAGNGDAVGMGLAAAGAIPAFAVMRTVSPSILTKAGDVAKKVPDAVKTGLAYIGAVSADTTADHLYGD